MDLGTEKPLRRLDASEILNLLVLANSSVRRNVSERVSNCLVHEHALLKQINLELILSSTPLAVSDTSTDCCENRRGECCYVRCPVNFNH